jgi:hypothetical protein
MSTSNPRPILILSGLPGIGKSELAEALQLEGWLRLSVDEEDKAPPRLRAAWSSAFNGIDSGLRSLAATCPGVVIEWGFHTVDLPTIEALIDRGYDVWYFDGDRGTALAGWKTAHPTSPEHSWYDQVERLDKAAIRIARLFGPKALTTTRPDGTRLTVEEIRAHIGVPPRPPGGDHDPSR